MALMYLEVDVGSCVNELTGGLKMTTDCCPCQRGATRMTADTTADSVVRCMISVSAARQQNFHDRSVAIR